MHFLKGKPLKMLFFEFLRKICCGYSKLVSKNAWLNAKGISSIRSSSAEKMSKNWWFDRHPEYVNFLTHCGRFLSPELSDWADSFFIESGILRYKFRLTTAWFSEKLKNKFFNGLPFKNMFTHYGVIVQDFELSCCNNHMIRQL